ncbi:DUF3019 domain-containing protein [Alteromonas sp. a30]|uniref:DUF3019 domain-containing protein n=1 Tax=Alteromonas sp. a30 TaxID=2730917 RepID=UPI002280047B|nr:DUF3019 domain-containing protein [Alteromonas sp. a30]MCY7294707.1 DUF3019 domain-containing protein [Alteromonas sp. a30]
MKANAQVFNWDVNPSACVVRKPGDSCRLNFEITMYEGFNKEACLYWDDIQLQCWSALPQKFSWPLEISQTGSLSLRYNEEIFVTKNIEIKSLLPNKRRRVRSPWSMF